MALTRDFRETVQARAQKDEKFRRGLLSDAVEALLAYPLTGGLPGPAFETWELLVSSAA